MPEFKDEAPQRGSYSEAVTNNVRVEVESEHIPQRVTANAFPLNGQWLFHYTVRITNEGDETVQLISRHWIITARQRQRLKKCRGRGSLASSRCSRRAKRSSTRRGVSCRRRRASMRGTYQMVAEDGAYFDVEIAPFTLHEPYTVH